MVGVSRDVLLDLLAEEKEAFALYEQLCARYQTSPDPVAVAASKARMLLLQQLLSEDTEPHARRRITSLLRLPTKNSG